MRANSLALRLFLSATVVDRRHPARHRLRAVRRSTARRSSARSTGGSASICKTLVADVAAPEDPDEKLAADRSASRCSSCRCRAGTGRSRGSTAPSRKCTSSRSLWDRRPAASRRSWTSPPGPRRHPQALCARARRTSACAWSSAPSISARKAASWSRSRATPPRSTTRSRAFDRALVDDLRACWRSCCCSPRMFQVRFGLAPLKRISREPCGDPLRHGRAARRHVSRSRSRRSRARPTR